MANHGVRYWRAALANYDEWIEKDPNNVELRTRREEIVATIERLQERNRAKHHKQYEPRLNRKRIEVVRRKIAEKEKTIEYCERMMPSNSTYFHNMKIDMQFQIRVLRTELRTLIKENE